MARSLPEGEDSKSNPKSRKSGSPGALQPGARGLGGGENFQEGQRSAWWLSWDERSLTLNILLSFSHPFLQGVFPCGSQTGKEEAKGEQRSE